MTMDRQARFLWMQDLLEHLGACHEQWPAAEPAVERFLADAVRRDLDELRRLCDSLVDEQSYRPSDRLAAA
ncbi:MAG TPA: hypothetical protein VHY20_07955 [Pirellulales bacterium]|nr:hypothetical protein [Pirellulales bacterium]